MVSLDQMIINLQNFLKKKEDLSDVTFVPAYAGKVKSIPLNGPVVALSVLSMEDMDVKPVYTMDDTNVSQLVYNHILTVRLALDIYVPQTDNGVGCYEVFSRMQKYLPSVNYGCPFVGTGCKGMEYYRDAGTFTLSTYVDLEQKSIAT
jgi:hypothetical protein